jgi:small subunit ribosomal protein S3
MGQKINPTGFRLAVTKNWTSRWYANNTDFAKMLKEDVDVRIYLKKKLKNASVSKVIIERPAKNARITIYSSRPGVVIGKKGADIDNIKKALSKFTKDEVHLNIVPVAKPELDSTLIAQSIAQQLEKRVAFRRAMKRAVQSCLRLGALGIRVNVSGRLGGAEIARMEWYREGRVPLHTLRADVDYGIARAETAYGTIGVKVWVFKGDILGKEKVVLDKPANDAGVIEPVATEN